MDFSEERCDDIGRPRRLRSGTDRPRGKHRRILFDVKGVAAFLALLIAVIVTADPLCCPDGCSHEGLTGGGSQAGVDCPVCHVAAVTTGTPVRQPSIVQTPAPIPAGFLPVPLFHRVVEHPPRPQV